MQNHVQTNAINFLKFFKFAKSCPNKCNHLFEFLQILEFMSFSCTRNCWCPCLVDVGVFASMLHGCMQFVWAHQFEPFANVVLTCLVRCFNARLSFVGVEFLWLARCCVVLWVRVCWRWRWTRGVWFVGPVVPMCGGVLVVVGSGTMVCWRTPVSVWGERAGATPV